MEAGKLVGKGRVANVYEWGENEVIKLFEPSVSNSIVEREYKKSVIVQQLGVSMPLAKNTIQFQGQNGIIYERLIGNTLLKIMKSTPLKMKKSIEHLAELHVKLSNCNTSDLPNIKVIIKESMKCIDEKILDQSKRSLISSYVDSLPDSNALCHLDFHPDNIIITKNGPKILDWCNAASGDPCADAAVTVIIFTLCNNPPGTSKFVDIMSKILAKRIRTIYLNKYLLLSHRTYEDVDRWLLPAAVLRLSYNLPRERDVLMDIINSKLVNFTQTEFYEK